MMIIVALIAGDETRWDRDSGLGSRNLNFVGK
jgi:hypothetical protein